MSFGAEQPAFVFWMKCSGAKDGSEDCRSRHRFWCDTQEDKLKRLDLPWRCLRHRNGSTR